MIESQKPSSRAGEYTADWRSRGGLPLGPACGPGLLASRRSTRPGSGTRLSKIEILSFAEDKHWSVTSRGPVGRGCDGSARGLAEPQGMRQDGVWPWPSWGRASVVRSIIVRPRPTPTGVSLGQDIAKWAERSAPATVWPTEENCAYCCGDRHRRLAMETSAGRFGRNEFVPL
jgi:hypothetical protein